MLYVESEIGLLCFVKLKAISTIVLCSGGALVRAPETAASLPGVLLRQAERPDGGLLRSFLQANGSFLAWSARELLVGASRILGQLRADGLQPRGARGVQLDSSHYILSGFLGCLLGGFVPVITGVPPSYQVQDD